MRPLAMAAALCAQLVPSVGAADDVGRATAGGTVAAPEAGPLADGGEGAGGGTDAAIGRLNRAGYRERRHCTASLVAPREAVTALHCVEGIPVGELHLLLGYDRGEFAEHHRVASVIASEGADVARLCLAEASAAEPLPSAAAVPEPGPAVVRGYPRTRAHAQEPRACGLVPGDGSALATLDCPLEQGFSGSPVRSPGPDGPVIGVASASNATMSVAALLTALPERRCPQ